MKPKSVSASSLNNWFSCERLFAAANLDYVPEFGEKNAANVGTVVHYALEYFVDAVFIKKTHTWDDLAYLLKLYHEGFLKIFGRVDKMDDDFKDGLALTKKWHKRTDLSRWEIMSVEEKRQLPIAQTGVLLTFIFDRIQRQVTDTGRIVVKVVDYKTIQRSYSHEQLEKMLQMRLYGLAAAMQAKLEGWHYDELWVELDLLRKDGPVGIEITREMNEETWDLLLEVVEHILNTDKGQVKATLGPNCKWCPVANDCPEAKKHIAAGGVLGKTIEEIVHDYYELKAQSGIIEGLLGQHEAIIQAHAEKIEKVKFDVAGHPVVISAGSRRDISDASVAAGIIGPELMKMFGNLKISDVDKLLDSDQLTPVQKAQLSRLIVRKPNKQSLKVEPPSPFAKEKS